jgi:hypothetical protein
MFVITLVAVGAAVAAWMRPLPEMKSMTPSAPTFSVQQVTDAKSKVCAAYWEVQKAISSNAGRNGGDDPNTQLLVATTQQMVFVAGSAHLMTTLADEPATSGDLALAVKKLADLFQVMTLDGLVGDRNDPAHGDATQAASTIQSLCK